MISHQNEHGAENLFFDFVRKTFYRAREDNIFCEQFVGSRGIVMKQTTGAFHLCRAVVSEQVLCLISSLNAPGFSRTRPWGDVFPFAHFMSQGEPSFIALCDETLAFMLVAEPPFPLYRIIAASLT